MEKAKSLINNTDTICAYGMSLGESDLCWRNMLIEWLMGNQSNHLFIYRYLLYFSYVNSTVSCSFSSIHFSPCFIVFFNSFSCSVLALSISRSIASPRLMGNQSNHLFIYRYNLSKAEYVTVGERMDIEEDAKERLLNEWGIYGIHPLDSKFHRTTAVNDRRRNINWQNLLCRGCNV